MQKSKGLISVVKAVDWVFNWPLPAWVRTPQSPVFFFIRSLELLTCPTQFFALILKIWLTKRVFNIKTSVFAIGLDTCFWQISLQISTTNSIFNIKIWSSILRFQICLFDFKCIYYIYCMQFILELLKFRSIDIEYFNNKNKVKYLIIYIYIIIKI